ncbi:hypothetical protein NDU88_001059 [Pleurodeles waltl]|uniref:Uncharacterized protein n=1 Tax=Pleurodeles waltl TaxID=8319 RepID=A0AAV7LYM1_PLEWA|nr:hypothetical protein NDU88_001059 [Pleurodeles waltl]
MGGVFMRNCRSRARQQQRCSQRPCLVTGKVIPASVGTSGKHCFSLKRARCIPVLCKKMLKSRNSGNVLCRAGVFPRGGSGGGRLVFSLFRDRAIALKLPLRYRLTDRTALLALGAVERPTGGRSLEMRTHC